MVSTDVTSGRKKSVDLILTTRTDRTPQTAAHFLHIRDGLNIHKT